MVERPVIRVARLTQCLATGLVVRENPRRVADFVSFMDHILGENTRADHDGTKNWAH